MHSIPKTLRFWSTVAIACLFFTGLSSLSWEQAIVSLFSPVTRSPAQAVEVNYLPDGISSLENSPSKVEVSCRRDR